MDKDSFLPITPDPYPELLSPFGVHSRLSQTKTIQLRRIVVK